MMKRFSLAGLVAALMIVMPAVQAEDLLQIYQKALLSDPAIKEAAANRDAALEAQPSARGFLLPQIDADATFSDDTSDGLRNTAIGGVNVPQAFDS
jgi:outer membrane protein